MDYSKMTLREKVLQTFIVTIREINRHGGPQQFFSDYPVAGMYYAYLPGSEGTVETGTGTNPQRLSECRSASKLPLLICADGCSLNGQTILASERAVGAIQSEDTAYLYGKILGMQMKGNDVDWVLCPIVDLLYSREMPLFALSDDPVLTAKLSRAIIRGIQDQGICATAKHFPGLGTCNINMHFGPGQNLLSIEDWMTSYGRVYKEAFQEQVCSVMTTHITFPAYQIEGENGFYPIATYSSKITTELLKNTLDFQGVVVTDALIMGGMATGDQIEECVQAFRAGADLLLWPPVEAADRIAELLESGEIPMSRLDDALNRIQRMRAFREHAIQTKQGCAPDVSYVDHASAEINQKAICLLRNRQDLLPLGKHTFHKLLIVDVTDDGKSTSSILLKNELARAGFSVEVVRNIYDVPSRVCWQSDIAELQSRFDLVIFNVDMEYATAWNVPFMLVWASHLFDKKKKVIVNYGSPFFADTYFPEDPTYIEVNADPTAETVHSVVERLLGLVPFTGKPILHQKPQFLPTASVK